ncbi:hypothetical protein GQ53DRAFT_835490 [Thozetella sp. PMI_491]|nr:hypothetical protein GQ53DRAFT_835490 [Thozetella sp. PMI_491]
METKLERAPGTHRPVDNGHNEYDEQSARGDVRLYVVVSSEYLKFDLSGGLPFSIVFHLCRYAGMGAADDKSLLFDMSGSVFDVPFALGNGLLRLYDDDAGSEVDLRAMGFNPPPSRTHIYRLDPKPKGHRTRVAQGLTVPVPVSSPLAKLLKPRTKYSIRLDQGRLGISWWAYGDPSELLVDGKPAWPSERTNLVAKTPGTGRALFWTASSLVVPPTVEIRMAWEPLGRGADEGVNPSECVISLSIVSRHQEPISIQSSGRQRYLFSRAPAQPEIDDRPRITSTTDGAAIYSFSLTHIDTGNVAAVYKRPACSGVMAGNADIRPMRRHFTTLEPGKPLVKSVNVETMVSNLRLGDGTYRVSLQTLGAYWCPGSVSEIFGSAEDNARIPHEIYDRSARPVCLSSPDTVDIVVAGGKYRAVI